jgi:MFS family permease
MVAAVIARATVPQDAAGSVTEVRRLLLVVCAIVAADTAFFTALTPLLPHFAEHYDLSKGAAGVFVSTYAIGSLLGAVPGGLVATRFGPKAAVASGLTLMTAASLGFALGGDVWTLSAARLLQGVGSTFSWAGGLAWITSSAPGERRGELLGTAMGAAVFGSLLGPILGGIAGVAGVRAAFLGMSVVGLALLVLTASTRAAARQEQRLGDSVRVLRDREVLAGLWLILLPALLFGALVVLVPLRLHRHGWGAVAIGAVFLATAGLETLINPLLGRYADRRGLMQPIRAALIGSVAVSVAFALSGNAAVIAGLVLIAGIVYGAFYTPGLALISHGAEAVGVAQGLAFGLMNACWSVGAIAGPAIGGALAEAAGDAATYLVLAAVCAATYVALRVQGRAAAAVT